MSFLSVPLAAFLDVFLMILGLYQTAIFIYVILGWLENFGIINRYNQFVYTLHTVLFRVIEPALGGIRRFLPAIGGIDFSPLVLLLITTFLIRVIARLVH